MISELLPTSTLVQVLVQYLSRARSTPELEEWLVSNLQGFLDSGDRDAIEIANQVDALLVELSEGLISEIQLRDGISTIIARRRHQLAADSSASANSIIISEPIVLTSSVLIKVHHSFAPAEADR